MAFTMFSKDLVYYDILTSDADKYNKPYLHSVYEEAVSNIKPINFTRQGGNSSKLLAMARAEAMKEQALLRQVFNVSAPSNFDGPEDVKALTEAINSVFHFKQVYERNKAMLTSPEFRSGIKAVFSWYPTYFVRFFSKQQKTISNKITEAMAANPSLTLKAATKQVMEALLPEINFKAVRAMLTEAQTEIGVDESYQQAYRDIFNAIQQDFERGISNPFLEGIRKTYGLDKIVREMSKQVNHRSKNRLLEDVSSGIKNIDRAIKGGGYGGATIYTGGGYALEHLIDQVLSMTIKDIKSGSNGEIKWTAQMLEGAGSYNAQPDNVLVITEDSTNLLKKLENDLSQDGIGDRNREQAIKAFSNMSNNLAKLNSGFIVYFNDKNYNIGNNLAHKAGDMTLDQLRSIVGPLVDDINQAIYNILQMAEGAVGEGLDESTSTAIAQAIAYFLFDDYNTIGTFSTGGNSIHVMALEGIMIPLSAYLFAMGKALEEANNVNGYVHVTITPPDKIAFGEGVKDESRSGGARFYRDNWYKQQEASLKSARVKATFLKNLSSMVRNYLV